LSKQFLVAGSFFGIIAILLGAFGAHQLQTILSKKSLNIYEIANKYLFYHSFFLIILGLAYDKIKQHKLLNQSGIFIIIGMILFSGSLYLISIFEIKKIGLITPLGGLSFIIGWILFLWSILKNKA